MFVSMNLLKLCVVMVRCSYSTMATIAQHTHTYISSLWPRESHHSRLSTGSLWTRWAGATILTIGTLSRAQVNMINL